MCFTGRRITAFKAGKGGSGIYFMILALSFLVPDAIVSTPYSLEYIETVERITDSAYAIAGQSVGVNEPHDAGSWARFKTSASWPNWDILKLIQNRRRLYRMEKAHSQVQA